jgi:hypothetical protein
MFISELNTLETVEAVNVIGGSKRGSKRDRNKYGKSDKKHRRGVSFRDAVVSEVITETIARQDAVIISGALSENFIFQEIEQEVEVEVEIDNN